MLIDNLSKINSVADLFQYICNIEEELENVTKERDALLVLVDNKNTLIRELGGTSNNVQA